MGNIEKDALCENERRAGFNIGVHHPIFGVVALYSKSEPMATGNDGRRSILVDVLIILFGISSWVVVNGLWVELPLLVKTLPEKWNLASYIVVTTQLANLGPIVFSAARKLWSHKVLEVPIIHASLAIVVISCGLLGFLWDATSYVAGVEHSTAFLALTFLVSWVDCTASLLYLPFIANFKEQYVISYMLGSGLSGPIPGILALMQGVGGYAECRNVTVTEFGNETVHKLETYYPPPRYSVGAYFGALCGQIVLSWLGFVLLIYHPRAKKERAAVIPVSRPSNPAVNENFQSSVEKDLSTSLGKTTSSEQNLLGKAIMTPRQFCQLLAMHGFMCALNTFLLSIQTYSCLPYGSIAYHLTTTMSSFSNPIFCTIAMFFPIKSVASVFIFSAFGAAWGMYILAMALLSPQPLLVGTSIGSFLVILSWILVCGTIAFVKSCIAAMLRRGGGQAALYRCGIATQIGSAIGAIVPFILLQYTTLFHSFSPCS